MHCLFVLFLVGFLYFCRVLFMDHLQGFDLAGLLHLACDQQFVQNKVRAMKVEDQIQLANLERQIMDHHLVERVSFLLDHLEKVNACVQYLRFRSTYPVPRRSDG